MRCEVFIALCIVLVVFVATLPKMYWIYAISIYRAEKLRRFFNGDCECFLFNATFQQPYSIDQNEFWHTNWDTLFNGIFPGPAYWFVSCRILIYDTLNHPITQMCDFNFLLEDSSRLSMWRLDYIYVFCREAFVLMIQKKPFKWNETKS